MCTLNCFLYETEKREVKASNKNPTSNAGPKKDSSIKSNFQSVCVLKDDFHKTECDDVQVFLITDKAVEEKTTLKFWSLKYSFTDYKFVPRDFKDRPQSYKNNGFKSEDLCTKGQNNRYQVYVVKADDYLKWYDLNDQKDVSVQVQKSDPREDVKNPSLAGPPIKPTQTSLFKSEKVPSQKELIPHNYENTLLLASQTANFKVPKSITESPEVRVNSVESSPFTEQLVSSETKLEALSPNGLVNVKIPGSTQNLPNYSEKKSGDSLENSDQKVVDNNVLSKHKEDPANLNSSLQSNSEKKSIIEDDFLENNLALEGPTNPQQLTGSDSHTSIPNDDSLSKGQSTPERSSLSPSESLLKVLPKSEYEKSEVHSLRKSLSQKSMKESGTKLDTPDENDPESRVSMSHKENLNKHSSLSSSEKSIKSEKGSLMESVHGKSEVEISGYDPE